MSGTLFLVVGPSGAGKDTLIGAARRMLAGDPHILFPQRMITRPADAGGEDHIPITEGMFNATPFALSWRAHGLAYGIPLAIDGALAQGRDVVINVSRGVIAEAMARYPLVRVIQVTAPAETLRQRLAERDRESSADQAARAARQASIPADVDVIEIVNDGTVAEGGAKLVAVFQAALNGAR